MNKCNFLKFYPLCPWKAEWNLIIFIIITTSKRGISGSKMRTSLSDKRFGLERHPAAPKDGMVMFRDGTQYGLRISWLWISLLTSCLCCCVGKFRAYLKRVKKNFIRNGCFSIEKGCGRDCRGSRNIAKIKIYINKPADVWTSLELKICVNIVIAV